MHQFEVGRNTRRNARFIGRRDMKEWEWEIWLFSAVVNAVMLTAIIVIELVR